MHNLTLFKAIFSAYLIILAYSCNRTIQEGKIPITSQSEEALELYNQADRAHKSYQVGLALELFDQAVKEDPDFFRAAERLALYNLFFGDTAAFYKSAKTALSSDLELSEGEALMRKALEKLFEEPENDVTAYGEKLVDLYPDDYMAYYELGMYNWLAGNFEGVAETFTRALDAAEDQGLVYNIIGYAYMQLEEYDKAAEAFDKNIQLSPDKPNPYDSKGDYFMAIGDYQKAFESYSKAAEIDSGFTLSSNKAMMAKMMLESEAAE